MDTKPELIRLEPVDPTTLPGTNMYIKNEVFYDENHTPFPLQNHKTYIPEPIQTFPSKPMSQYPKYQTPKLRAKSSYSPVKTIVAPSAVANTPMYQMKSEAASQQQILLEHLATAAAAAASSTSSADTTQSHLIASTGERAVEHNAVQVITPNANYAAAAQQWSPDVTMTPIMEQTMPADIVGQTLPPDTIFIPESSNVIADGTDYGVMNGATINLIPVMTPNGLVLMATNNSQSSMLGGDVAAATAHHQQPPAQTHHHAQQQQHHLTAPPKVCNSRRKPSNKKSTTALQQMEVVPQDMGTGAPNVIYMPNGPVVILNDTPMQITGVGTPQPHQIVEKIPEKGTVIVEEPLKTIYQSRRFTGSDINENSTHYSSKKGAGGVNREAACDAQFDAELDLDAALTVFKIYK